MKSYDYNAYTCDGAVYCITCLPPEAHDDDIHPIFADSEWDYVPVCDACGMEHDYVTILGGDK
jgi:hypothetical protein